MYLVLDHTLALPPAHCGMAGAWLDHPLSPFPRMYSGDMSSLSERAVVTIKWETKGTHSECCAWHEVAKKPYNVRRKGDQELNSGEGCASGPRKRNENNED